MAVETRSVAGESARQGDSIDARLARPRSAPVQVVEKSNSDPSPQTANPERVRQEGTQNLSTKVISLGVNTGERPPSREQLSSSVANSADEKLETGSVADDTLINVSEGPVRVRTKAGIVELNEDYLTNADNLIKNHSRKMNQLSAREREIADREQRITAIANDPLVRTYQALVDGGKSDSEARVEVARLFAAPTQTTRTLEEELGAMPVPPEDGIPGSTEWNDYEIARTTWLNKSNDVQLKRTLAPILQANEQQQAQRENASKVQDILEHNTRMAVKVFEYLPFDYSTLSAEQQTAVRTQLEEVSAERGFNWDDQQALRTQKVSDLFLENVALRAFPDGKPPQSAQGLGSSGQQTNQQSQANHQQVAVERQPPTPPLTPPAGTTGFQAAPINEARARNNGPSWVSKLGPVSNGSAK